MLVPYLWCDIPNFGDALNVTLMKEVAGISLYHSSIKRACVLGIGSLLEQVLSDSNAEKIKDPISIFSSGFGFEEGQNFHNKSIIIPEKLKRNINCYAVRGELSKQRLEKLTGDKLTCVVGDGGLLSSLLIDKKTVIKKYRVGIVPHYGDKNSPILKLLNDSIPGSKIINVQQPVKCFLQELSACSLVISTAMHPLIACDALRIPNLWIRVTDTSSSYYKFDDYYSSLDKHVIPYDLRKNRFTNGHIDQFIDEYDISDAQIEDKQERLLLSLNTLKRDLQSSSLWYRWRKQFYWWL